MKTIHISEVIAEGGRDGRIESPDGGFSVRLSTDEKPGSVTSEHLFAGAYASCFLAALKKHAEKEHGKIEGITVVGRAHLEENGPGDYKLHIELRATIPGVDDSKAEHLLNLAHQTCPYSKATRGNIEVKLAVD